jgi:hypothetical protein
MHDPYAANASGLLEDVGRAIRKTAVYGGLRRIADWMDDHLFDANEGDGTYDWRADYEGWKHVYPEEIFLNSSSAGKSRRAMARYDKWQRDRTAQTQHPVTNFLFNAIGFGADLAALEVVPFIGGLGLRLGGLAGKAIAQTSILRDAVVCSTAAMLDVGEVELARVLADEFETFGDNAAGIAANVVLAGLLGAGLGSLKGRGRVRTLGKLQRARVLTAEDVVIDDEQKLIGALLRGEEVEMPGGGHRISKATLTADIENATNIFDVDLPPLSYGEKATLEKIIGKIPTEPEKRGLLVSRWLNRILGSHVVRSQESDCPITRVISAKIADSRQPRLDEFGAEIQGQEALIRVHKNKTMNFVRRTLHDSFEKMRKDKDPTFSKISRENFYEETAKAILTGYESSNPYAAEASAAFKPILDEAWGFFKKADLGDRIPPLLEKFEKQVAERETELNKFTEQHKAKPSKRLQNKIARTEERLAEAKADLERVQRGDLTDAEWGRQTQDRTYRPRIYKIQEIAARKVEFANRIADWLIRAEREVSRKDAFQAGLDVANQILGNSYTRMPHGVKISKVRGMERARTLDIPSLEIVDFLENNPLAIFERLTNTIYPDFYLKNALGELSLDKVHKAITSWYDGEMVAGRMKPVDAQKALRRDEDALNGLMAAVRGTSNLTGEAMMRNRNVTNILGATRSINSTLMLGGLPTTALFDLSTISMTFGVERAFGTALPTFLNLFEKTFRTAIREDMAQLGVEVECLLQQHHGRYGVEFDPNLYGLSESVTGWLRDKTGKLAQFTYKWNGSLHALGYARATAYYTAEITLRDLAEKARLGGVMSSAEKNLINTGRLTPERLAHVGEQIAKFSEKRAGATVFNLEKWDNIHAKNDFITACINWTDRAILEPHFEQHAFMRNSPLWQMVFQFKNFLFTAVDRCLLPNVRRLESGELHLLGAILASVALGGFRDLLNRAVDGSDMPTPRQFIVQGIAYSDMFPFAGDLFKEINHSFGTRDVLEHVEDGIGRFFLEPPTFSTAKNFLRGANGITDLLRSGKMTKREANALMQCIPMNNNYIVRRHLRKLLQTFTEDEN